jgi:streptogramin lyase
MIWIGTYSLGLNLFDTKTERFTRYRKVFNDSKSLSDDAVYTILVDRTGIAWFGTWSAGINKYDNDKEKFITYSHNREMNSLNVMLFTQPQG